MATFFLMNSIDFQGTHLRVAKLIDDTKFNTTLIANAGGQLWPSGDAKIATIAKLIQSKQLNQGIDDTTATFLMLSAINVDINVPGGSLGGTLGAATVLALDGTAGVVASHAIRVTPDLGLTSFTLQPGDNVTGGATGYVTKVSGQNATGGGGAVGGELQLGAGTGVTNGSINFINMNTATTIGAAGGASALPATPTGYVIVKINGTLQKIPFYAP